MSGKTDIQEIREVTPWDVTWLELARVLAEERSKDPNTKVGCIIIDPEKDQAHKSSGYNGFPIGVSENEERWERPEKYNWVVHAEANAIAMAARQGHSTNGCTLYTQHKPCSICARLIIQAGIKRVVVDSVINESWQYKNNEDPGNTEQLFKEAGVKLEMVRYER